MGNSGKKVEQPGDSGLPPEGRLKKEPGQNDPTDSEIENRPRAEGVLDRTPEQIMLVSQESRRLLLEISFPEAKQAKPDSDRFNQNERTRVEDLFRSAPGEKSPRETPTFSNIDKDFISRLSSLAKQSSPSDSPDLSQMLEDFIEFRKRSPESADSLFGVKQFLELTKSGPGGIWASKEFMNKYLGTLSERTAKEAAIIWFTKELSLSAHEGLEYRNSLLNIPGSEGRQAYFDFFLPLMQDQPDLISLSLSGLNPREADQFFLTNKERFPTNSYISQALNHLSPELAIKEVKVLLGSLSLPNLAGIRQFLKRIESEDPSDPELLKMKSEFLSGETRLLGNLATRIKSGEKLSQVELQELAASTQIKHKLLYLERSISPSSSILPMQISKLIRTTENPEDKAALFREAFSLSSYYQRFNILRSLQDPELWREFDFKTELSRLLSGPEAADLGKFPERLSALRLETPKLGLDSNFEELVNLGIISKDEVSDKALTLKPGKVPPLGGWRTLDYSERERILGEFALSETVATNLYKLPNGVELRIPKDFEPAFEKVRELRREAQAKGIPVEQLEKERGVKNIAIPEDFYVLSQSYLSKFENLRSITYTNRKDINDYFPRSWDGKPEGVIFDSAGTAKSYVGTFTITSHYLRTLASTFIHEAGHLLEENPLRSSFDLAKGLPGNDYVINQYALKSSAETWAVDFDEFVFNPDPDRLALYAQLAPARAIIMSNAVREKFSGLKSIQPPQLLNRFSELERMAIPSFARNLREAHSLGEPRVLTNYQTVLSDLTFKGKRPDLVAQIIEDPSLSSVRHVWTTSLLRQGSGIDGFALLAQIHPHLKDAELRLQIEKKAEDLKIDLDRIRNSQDEQKDHEKATFMQDVLEMTARLGVKNPSLAEKIMSRAELFQTITQRKDYHSATQLEAFMEGLSHEQIREISSKLIGSANQAKEQDSDFLNLIAKLPTKESIEFVMQNNHHLLKANTILELARHNLDDALAVAASALNKIPFFEKQELTRKLLPLMDEKQQLDFFQDATPEALPENLVLWDSYVNKHTGYLASTRVRASLKELYDRHSERGTNKVIEKLSSAPLSLSDQEKSLLLLRTDLSTRLKYVSSTSWYDNELEEKVEPTLAGLKPEEKTIVFLRIIASQRQAEERLNDMQSFYASLARIKGVVEDPELSSILAGLAGRIFGGKALGLKEDQRILEKVGKEMLSDETLKLVFAVGDSNLKGGAALAEWLTIAKIFNPQLKMPDSLTGLKTAVMNSIDSDAQKELPINVLNLFRIGRVRDANIEPLLPAEEAFSRLNNVADGAALRFLLDTFQPSFQSKADEDFMLKWCAEQHAQGKFVYNIENFLERMRSPRLRSLRLELIKNSSEPLTAYNLSSAIRDLAEKDQLAILSKYASQIQGGELALASVLPSLPIPAQVDLIKQIRSSNSPDLFFDLYRALREYRPATTVLHREMEIELERLRPVAEERILNGEPDRELTLTELSYMRLSKKMELRKAYLKEKIKNNPKQGLFMAIRDLDFADQQIMLNHFKELADNSMWSETKQFLLQKYREGRMSKELIELIEKN